MDPELHQALVNHLAFLSVLFSVAIAGWLIYLRKNKQEHNASLYRIPIKYLAIVGVLPCVFVYSLWILGITGILPLIPDDKKYVLAEIPIISFFTTTYFLSVLGYGILYRAIEKHIKLDSKSNPSTFDIILKYNLAIFFGTELALMVVDKLSVGIDSCDFIGCAGRVFLFYFPYMFLVGNIIGVYFIFKVKKFYIASIT